MRTEVRWCWKNDHFDRLKTIEKPRYVPGWEPGLRWDVPAPFKVRTAHASNSSRAGRIACALLGWIWRMDLTDDLQIFPKKPQLGTDLDDVYHWLCGVDVVGWTWEWTPNGFEVRWSWAFVGTLRVTFEWARRLVCPVGCGDKIFETYLDEKVSLLIICCMVSKERGSYCKPLNSPRIQPCLAMRQLLWWEQPYRLGWNGWNLKAKRVCQGTPILPTLLRIFMDFYLLISNLSNDIDWKMDAS